MGSLPRAFRADICHRTFDTLTNVIGTERERARARKGAFMGTSVGMLMKN